MRSNMFIKNWWALCFAFLINGAWVFFPLCFNLFQFTFLVCVTVSLFELWRHVQHSHLMKLGGLSEFAEYSMRRLSSVRTSQSVYLMSPSLCCVLDLKLTSLNWWPLALTTIAAKNWLTWRGASSRRRREPKPTSQARTSNSLSTSSRN